ncbi:MAG: hypothetical protein KDA63_13165 [Planctomycetales bacterium]|nr:hypothetical protein [Planctomycetales bacterium]
MPRQLLCLFAVLLLLVRCAAAAEPRVLFEDTLDGELADGWSWLRENPDAWRFGGGGLEIHVEPGKADTVKNALVRPLSDALPSDYAIELTVTFTSPPTNQFEQGGITWYHDDKPAFKFVHEHIDGEEWIIPGRKPAPNKTVQLRLEVRGDEWTARYRENAEDAYLTADSGNLPRGNDQISIQCYEGPADAEHWIRFEDFRIIELNQ